MTQMSLSYPAAVIARRSGLTEGRRTGPTLRQRYLELLENHPEGLSDHEAGAVLGALSTTIGARRSEVMEAQPGRIESCGRVKVGRVSRAVWRLAC